MYNFFINVCIYVGCPANQATNGEGLTPQKIAKTEGYKDAMKELKKLTTFQDKAEKGGKPKGFAEPWAVRVRPLQYLVWSMHVRWSTATTVLAKEG